MAVPNRPTFRQIVESSRIDAAASAWSRAKFVSAMRHKAADAGRASTANRLSRLKTDAIRLVLSLVPEQVSVTIDDDYQIGLLSVRWPGHGRLHLPADTQLV